MSYELRRPYEPASQWVEWGEWYESEFSAAGYVEAEKILTEVLGGLAWETVLDVGCGFGRLGELVRRLRPGALYTGIDVSPHQIDAAHRRLPNADLHVADIYEWEPSRTWDLVLSAEVLMHQPSDRIEGLMQRIVGWSSKWIVTCDWYEPGMPDNDWNYCHDYPALYGERLVSTSPFWRQAVFVARA